MCLACNLSLARGRYGRYNAPNFAYSGIWRNDKPNDEVCFSKASHPTVFVVVVVVVAVFPERKQKQKRNS
jgi:hypothetical protein